MNSGKVAAYIVISYGLTWLLWFPLLLNRQWNTGLPIIPYQFYLGAFGPLFGAVAASLLTGGAQELKRWFGRTYSLRFPFSKLGLAFFMLLLYSLVAVLAHRFVIGIWPDFSQFGLTDKLPGLPVWQVALVWIVTFGLGEESGWRGFLLPELNKRFSLRTSSLLVAAVWIFWHLPAFWFNENYMRMGFGILGWSISLTFGAILLAWLCQSSRFSIIPVIIWHGGFDLITASDQGATVMAMACSMLVIVQGIYLVRKMAQSELGKSK